MDNLPVGEVRAALQRRRGDRRRPWARSPLPAEQVTGLFSVAAQVITLLTEQNVKASLASLGPRDIHLQPDLGSITSSDFARHVEAAERGRAAAEAQQSALSALSVSEAQYAAWQRSVRVRALAAPRVDEVQVAGLQRTDAARMQRHLEQRLGQPLDTTTLTRDLMQAYGDGDYEQVDYSLQRVASATCCG